MISKFDENFDEQNRKIDELGGKLPSKQIQLTSSSSNVTVMNNIADAIA